MIALDTNLLVYAYLGDSPWHPGAKRLITDLAEGPQNWAIPWPCVHEFLSVVTNPRAFQSPAPMDDAVRQLDFWMESPGLRLLSEAPGHWQRLCGLARHGHLVGPMIHDARLAAICLEHGVDEFWTADRDFSRMRGLRVRNPLL